MNCKNCGERIVGKYCSHCGQNASVGKISLSSLLNEFYDSVFQINWGFLFTLKSLFLHPGNSIAAYLSGMRKNHFKPITYVLVLSTLYFLFSQGIGQNTWIDELMSGFVSGARDSHRNIDMPFLLTWFSNNYAYGTLLLLPVFSLASYISFLNSGRNYLEHIVLNSYITGQQALIYLLFAGLRALIDWEFLETLSAVVGMAYAFWVFWQFFDKGSRVLNVLRSILTYVLYLIICIGSLLIVMAVSDTLS